MNSLILSINYDINDFRSHNDKEPESIYMNENTYKKLNDYSSELVLKRTLSRNIFGIKIEFSDSIIDNKYLIV
jgi:hypothetical protein